MKFCRPVLFALLLPLLLDCLLVFTWQPFASVEERTVFAQESIEVLEGIEEAEDQLEEETLHCCQFRCCETVLCPSACGRRLFFRSSSENSPLACGWSMPLLI